MRLGVLALAAASWSCTDPPPQAQCGHASKTEVAVIDDGDECFTLEGAANIARVVTGAGEQGDLMLAPNVYFDTSTVLAVWRLSVESKAFYQVEAHVDPAYASARFAHYQICSGVGCVDDYYDQTSVDGWLHLIDFIFDAEGAQRVELLNSTRDEGGRVEVMLDAVRISYVHEPPKLAEGCSVEAPRDSRSLGAWLVVLAGFVLARLRRRRRTRRLSARRSL